jgi:hypothetical protein
MSTKQLPKQLRRWQLLLYLLQHDSRHEFSVITNAPERLLVVRAEYQDAESRQQVGSQRRGGGRWALRS